MEYAVLGNSYFPTIQVEDKQAPIRDTIEQCYLMEHCRGIQMS